MQVEINEAEIIDLAADTKYYLSVDRASSHLQCSTSSSKDDLLAITNRSFGCVAEVLSSENLTLNHINVKESAFLHPGDFIKITDHFIRLIDENKLPFEGKSPFKLDSAQSNSKSLFTSVTGIRSFNPADNGELKILGKDHKFTYTTDEVNDTPFLVNYVDKKITLLCKKEHHVMLNGNKCNFSQLKNGDVINTNYSKFIVESPGTSSFSKYSPSHPKNMQLSEEYLDESAEANSNKFPLKENMWWISMVSGLILIGIVLVILKNNLS